MEIITDNLKKLSQKEEKDATKTKQTEVQGQESTSNKPSTSNK